MDVKKGDRVIVSAFMHVEEKGGRPVLVRRQLKNLMSGVFIGWRKLNKKSTVAMVVGVASDQYTDPYMVFEDDMMVG